jgi:hypothetical protein
MKTKKVKPAFAAIALSALFLTACNGADPFHLKKKTNAEPVADTETQSSVEAMWATFVVTDIDQVCGCMGESLEAKNFYIALPGQATVAPIRDINAKALIYGWNNTPCVDGHLRQGSIFMYYGPDPVKNPYANPNSVYYREFGFAGAIYFSEYKIDGWRISLYDPAAPAYVYNRLPNANYDPKTTNITWEIAGKFLIEHPSDPSKNIVWEGKLTKTLLNTSDPVVFNPSKQNAITWYNANGNKRATVSYYGEMNGTIGSEPWKMRVDQRTPLVRDFSCSPDRIARVTSPDAGVYTPEFEEFHPFVSGIASMTVGSGSTEKYPRQIYMGNEGSGDLPVQCDNSGEVLIKGNLYKIDFKK